MRLAVIGTGYVGLVAAAGFARLGHTVTAIDIDAPRIAQLARGAVPFHEPGLPELVADQIAAGRLAFTHDYRVGLDGAQIAFIAVGTPGAPDGSADISHVAAAARAVAREARGPLLLVIKSTVPPGTARRIAQQIERMTATPLAVASNPEFLREGSAIEDFLMPERVVIGADDDHSRDRLAAAYAPCECRLLVMDTCSAEISKYAANAMLASRISLMNEFARIADGCGADIERVRGVLASDSRIGGQFLRAGVGYGGSCFPKDVRALAAICRRLGVRPFMLEAIDHVNVAQPEALFAKIVTWFGGALRDRRFAVWGLAFKPGTDDLREAPALALVRLLAASGARVQAYDPAAANAARRLFARGNVSIVDSASAALAGADAMVLATEWDEFIACDPSVFAQELAARVVFDGRNALDPERLAAVGVAHVGIGRGLHAAREEIVLGAMAA